MPAPPPDPTPDGWQNIVNGTSAIVAAIVAGLFGVFQYLLGRHVRRGGLGEAARLADRHAIVAEYKELVDGLQGQLRAKEELLATKDAIINRLIAENTELRVAMIRAGRLASDGQME